MGRITAPAAGELCDSYNDSIYLKPQSDKSDRFAPDEIALV